MTRASSWEPGGLTRWDEPAIPPHPQLSIWPKLIPDVPASNLLLGKTKVKVLSIGSSSLEFELKATTEAGKQMVELAEKHATDFALTAAENDRKGTFPVENIRALRKSGFAAAGVPE